MIDGINQTGPSIFTKRILLIDGLSHYLYIDRVSTMQGGAGFLPSTAGILCLNSHVWPSLMFFQRPLRQQIATLGLVYPLLHNNDKRIIKARLRCVVKTWKTHFLLAGIIVVKHGDRLSVVPPLKKKQLWLCHDEMWSSHTQTHIYSRERIAQSNYIVAKPKQTI